MVQVDVKLLLLQLRRHGLPLVDLDLSVVDLLL